MIWNPWRRARELQAQLDRANRDNEHLEHLERALRDSVDRYDKIRDMNAHLREALRLYRNDITPAPVLLDYINEADQ